MFDFWIFLTVVSHFMSDPGPEYITVPVPLRQIVKNCGSGSTTLHNSLHSDPDLHLGVNGQQFEKTKLN